MAAPTRPYRGVSADQRRTDRRAALIEAGLDLLGTEGWSRTTMTAVCQRARLTERYFYESFPDRDGLLLAVFDHVVDELVQAIVAAVEQAPEDGRAKANAAIAAWVEFFTADPRKGRVVYVEAMGSEALMRRRLDSLRLFAQLLADHARALFRLPPDADLVVDHMAYLLVGGLTETLIAWRNGTLHSTKEQLVEICTDLFVATAEAATRIAAGRAPA